MNCPTDQRGIFLDLMEETRACVEAGGDPLRCETAYLSAYDDFTFHTHPNDVPYPSDVDIQTTKSLNKRFLCIGLVNEGRTICFDKGDGFNEQVCSF